MGKSQLPSGSQSIAFRNCDRHSSPCGTVTIPGRTCARIVGRLVGLLSFVMLMPLTAQADVPIVYHSQPHRPGGEPAHGIA
jgi:hypothetical protein